jgi:hypothetical protein
MLYWKGNDVPGIINSNTVKEIDVTDNRLRKLKYFGYLLFALRSNPHNVNGSSSFISFLKFLIV